MDRKISLEKFRIFFFNYGAFKLLFFLFQLFNQIMCRFHRFQLLPLNLNFTIQLLLAKTTIRTLRL